MTLLSLDIGVGRVGAFVVFVRVTPLGPAFAMVGRNSGTFAGSAAESLDCSGACSSALPFPFSFGSIVSGAGGTTGVGSAISVVVGGNVGGTGSGELPFSGGCESGIVGATGRTGSGSGAGPADMSGVEGTSGYGSAGIGGSTETDLERETRWEGGEGDLEGKRNDNGFGCGGIRCEYCLVRVGLGSGWDADGMSDRGGGCGKGTGRSMFMGSVVAALS